MISLTKPNPCNQGVVLFRVENSKSFKKKIMYAHIDLFCSLSHLSCFLISTSTNLLRFNAPSNSDIIIQFSITLKFYKTYSKFFFKLKHFIAW